MKDKHLDTLCKAVILLRDKYCQRCGSRQELVCSHVLRKGRRPWLRWDLDNVKILCDTCHQWWHANERAAAIEWFMRRWPDRWERLEIKLAQGYLGVGKKEELETELTNKLKELQDETMS